MSLLEKLGLKLLHQLDPERAHGVSIQALKLGLAPLHGPGSFAAPGNLSGRHCSAQPGWLGRGL